MIVFYLVLCVLIGAMGSSRKIGGFGAFILSLLLSPIIGILVVIGSDKVKSDATLDK